MPVDFDRYMVGYAASAYLDDAFDRMATKKATALSFFNNETTN